MKIGCHRGLAPLLVAMAVSWAGMAQAALFEDEEARRAVLELRQRVQQAEQERGQQAEENARLRRSLLDLQNQIEAVRAELARLRGTDEQLLRELAEVQRREKDAQQALAQRLQPLDERLRALEPQTVTVDGRELQVGAAERRDFDAAMAWFRSGDFARAQAAFLAFNRRHVDSAYTPSLLFWLGNAQYATRDYKEAVANFRAMLAAAPDHPRAPETWLAIANCQIELKDARAARRTLEDLVRLHPNSEAAQAGREGLARLR